jgi:hypothetical protein
MTDVDPWLTGEQCAELVGVTWSTWRRYVDLGLPKGNPIPKRGAGTRVNADTRRREWRRSLVQAWDARREGSPGRPRNAV